MAETVTIQKVYDEIKSLKEEVHFIKKHMFDPDTIMSSEEEKIFQQSLREYKEGKTKSLTQVKKDLGL